MTQDEFKAACIAAITEFHDPEQDGLLLIGTREDTKFSASLGRFCEPYLEYAAAIGEWPAHHHGNDYAQFTMHPTDSVAALKEWAQELHRTRQPEPEQEAEPEDEAKVAERKVYDALLD